MGKLNRNESVDGNFTSLLILLGFSFSQDSDEKLRTSCLKIMRGLINLFIYLRTVFNNSCSVDGCIAPRTFISG